MGESPNFSLGDKTVEELLFEVEGLRPCTVVERLNRFTVEVIIDGQRRVVHINNTGRLPGLLEQGQRGLCGRLVSPRRRTAGRLVAVECCGGHALIDTRLQERGFAEAVHRGLVPWLRGCRVAKIGPRVGSSMLDFLLDCDGEKIYVEIKSAAMYTGDGYAAYPDAPSYRARRQLVDALRAFILEKQEGRFMLVFIAAIPGARGVRLAEEVDPKLVELIDAAAEAGIPVKAIGLDLYQARWVRLYRAELPVLLP